MNLYNLRTYIFILALISAFLCVSTIKAIELIPLIPLNFGVAVFLCLPKRAYYGAGLSMLLLILCIRYIVYCPLCVWEYNSLFRFQGLINWGVFLMLVETWIIFLTIKFTVYTGKSEKPYPTIPSTPFFLLFLLIGFIIILLYPTIFANNHWVWQSSDISADKEDVNGALSVIIGWSQFFVIIYLFQLCYRKYEKTYNRTWIFYALLTVFLPCLYYTGHSRLSLLIPIVGFMFIMFKAFQKKGVKTSLLCAGYGIITLGILSLNKFFGTSEISEVNNFSAAHLLNAYFGGLQNITIGLQAWMEHTQTPYLFFIDSFRNVMGISHYFTYLPNTINIFNDTYFPLYVRNDQIPPTIIQGLMYFGPYLCFIPTVIMVWVVTFFDKLTAITKDTQKAYLYITFVVIVGWAVPGSWNHLATRFFNYFLPIYLLILIQHFLFTRKNVLSINR